MAINQQTFPTDLILPGLVDWFNSQPVNSRSISSSDIAMFRVRLVKDAAGTVSMIVGSAPYVAAGSTYLYEATFIWQGARGSNLTASSSSFFEISKFIAAPPTSSSQQPLNVYAILGLAALPDPKIIPFRTMTYGSSFWYSDNYNYENGFTGALTGKGSPVIQSDFYYWDDMSQLTNIVKLAGGGSFIGSIDTAGVVKYWGYGELANYNFSAIITYDLAANSPGSKVIDIAATRDCLLLIDDLGNTLIAGSIAHTGPGFMLPSLAKSVNTWYDSGVTYDTDGIMTITNKTAAFYINQDGSAAAVTSLCIQINEPIYKYDNTVTIACPVVSNAKKITGTFSTGAIITTNGDLLFWGDIDPTTAPGFTPSIVIRVADIQFTHDGQIIVLHTDGSHHYCDWNGRWVEPYELQTFGTVLQMSAGARHIMVLADNNGLQLAYYGFFDFRQNWTPGDLILADIQQIYAGLRHSAALKVDGTVVFWGGAAPVVN